MSDQLPPRLEELDPAGPREGGAADPPTRATDIDRSLQELSREAAYDVRMLPESSRSAREVPVHSAGAALGSGEAQIRPLADDQEWPRELVLASAGTGKTFHITSRLIALLAYGADPDHVLASTFTRKAAGEILHRTLDRLAEAALDDGKAAELAGHASVPGAPPLPSDRAFWSGLLERTVRKLHRLNVGTLDSFFIRAARAFEHDLRMPAGWRISEESAARQLRSRVLQDVIASMDRAEMTELLRLVNRGEARRSVHLHLLGLIEMLVTIHRELDPEVEGHWEAFGRRVITGPPPTGEDREQLAREVETYPIPTYKNGTPNRNWTKGVGDISAGIRSGNWTKVLKASLCDRRLKGEEAYDGRSLDEIGPLLDRVLDAARRSLRGSFVDQMTALGQFTARFEAALSRVQSGEGLYRFDDVTRLLAGDDPLGDRVDLYYRLDARTRHILLDEFQDTSLAQWEALAPIVDEVLAGAGRAGVIVADPKQSIYGWRGAEPRLVRHIGESYALTQRPLHRSYRSSQIVLDLVNGVFEGIGDSEILGRDEACRKSAEGWGRDFAQHQTNKPELRGFVSIEAGPRDPGSSRQRPLLCRRAAEKVAELHALSPHFTIGVLTRTNATVARMILELRRCGLHPSEEGGNPLTDSAACEAVLALIRLADHPGDRIARYHVARSPVGRVVGLESHLEDLAAATVAGRLRRELIADGYGAVLNRLARDLAPFCDGRELRRLMQLVELAYRHDARGSLRPAEFVYLAETERIEDPARTRVRVMTVHQAKGLEFDAVVLPELDSPLFYQPRFPAMPVRREPAGRVVAVYPNLRAEMRGLFPEVDEAFAQATGAALRDGLSNFYVALTRARHATYAVIAADDPAKPFRPNQTPACLLREALGYTATISEGEVVHEAGDADWWRTLVPDGAPRASLDGDGPGVRIDPRTEGAVVPTGSAAAGGDPQPTVGWRPRPPGASPYEGIEADRPTTAPIEPVAVATELGTGGMGTGGRSPGAIAGTPSGLDAAEENAFSGREPTPGAKDQRVAQGSGRLGEQLDIDLGLPPQEARTDRGSIRGQLEFSFDAEPGAEVGSDLNREAVTGGTAPELSGTAHAAGGTGGTTDAPQGVGEPLAGDVAFAATGTDETAERSEGFDDALHQQAAVSPTEAEPTAGRSHGMPPRREDHLPAHQRVEPEPGTRIRFPDRRRSRRLPRRTPSQLEGDSRVDVRYLLRLDTREAMRRGSIVHAWLEQIAWIDDGLPTEAELYAIASRIDPSLPTAEVRGVLEEFRRSVGHPRVRSALSRSAHPTGATPSREVRFLHREGETIVEGSIDRLVLTREGDRVVSAEVIDFKTDLQTNSTAILTDRVRHYTPQLAAYCRAVAAMYRIPLDAVTGKLIFLDSGHVVTTHPPDARD